MRRQFDHNETMELAIGGRFEEYGKIDLAALKALGLQRRQSLIDGGCGARRLAHPLSAYLEGFCLGIDLVPDLIAHAEKSVVDLIGSSRSSTTSTFPHQPKRQTTFVSSWS